MDARLPAAALVLALAAACGGGGTPAASPTPSPSATPSPTPTLPPVASDEAAVKKVLVTAADLGKPWVVPAKVNTTSTAKGELCPGKPNEQKRVPSRAFAKVSMTEGTKAGAAIASFEVRAFDPAKLDAYRDAFAAATKACAAYASLEKTYVTTEDVTAPAVAGTDWAVARLERVYMDSSRKKLYYVRQTIKAGVGRGVVSLEHAFVQSAADPTGADFTRTAALLEKQVTKAGTTFAW
ncbi:MAG TPA: hypothetical protein VF519_05465 [Mycobacteriales bacterium]|jgi:hypothetical protein